jgi:hypothetical protein
LLAAAAIALAACGSSGGNTASDNTGAQPTTSSTAKTTNAAAKECLQKLSNGGVIDDCQTSTTEATSPAAQDAIAQFALTASINAAQQMYDNTYDYTAVTPQSLAPEVPSVHYAPLDQAGAGVVGVLAQDKHDVLFVTKSASGRWYCITANNEDGISYGEATTLDKLNSNGECQQDSWPAPPA